jgi:hypothetical protein
MRTYQLAGYAGDQAIKFKNDITSRHQATFNKHSNEILK